MVHRLKDYEPFLTPYKITPGVMNRSVRFVYLLIAYSAPTIYF